MIRESFHGAGLFRRGRRWSVLPQNVECELLHRRMKLSSAVRIADEERDRHGITIRALDYHRDLPRLRKETMKERASMIGQPHIMAAAGLIPPDGRQARQFFIRGRSSQQVLEGIVIFWRKFERRTIVMLTFRHAAGANVNRARFVLTEQHTSDFHAAPGVAAIATHREFGDLREHASIALHLGNCAFAVPDDHRCDMLNQLCDLSVFSYCTISTIWLSHWIAREMEPHEQRLVPAASQEDHRHSRFSSHEKTDAVLRLLKGESVETVSQELGVTVGRIERWKNNFVAAGSAELAKRKDDSSKSWAAKHSRAIWQWMWLLVALVAVISILVLFMQRGSQE